MALLEFRPHLQETPLGSYPSCEHPLLPEPAFEEELTRNMPAHEVRRQWPRGSARCPNCGEWIVKYASYAHYIYGDW